MAIDFVSEVDRKFLAENMLTSEDLGESDSFWDNIFSVLPPCNEDLMRLPADMDYSLPPDLDQCMDDLWREHSDSSDSGIHNGQIKDEPASPTSSDTGLESIPLQSFKSVLTPSYSPVAGSQSPTFQNDVSVPTLYFTSDPTDAKKSVQSILSSQIKIQPKANDAALPTQGQTQQAFVKREPTTPKQLVLTSNEFVKLANQGLLKFKPPNEIPGISTQTLQPHELKNMKRQQRMIKNRESASLSRKRKKEYMSTLEIQLSHYLAENTQLKEENEALKHKIGFLSSENTKLKSQQGPITLTFAKKTTCLLAFVLFLGLNFGAFSDIFSSKSLGSFPQSSVHQGRHLMSVDKPEEDSNLRVNSEPYTQDVLMSKIRHIIETQTGDKNSTYPSYSQKCPTYFNSTQSVKLAERLAGWVMRHEQRYFDPPPPTSPPSRPHISRKASHNRRHQTKPTAFTSSDQVYQVQVFSQSHEQSRDLFTAIDRRNDTFYVLSFNTDYFLLPATRFNKTRRPRMSLVVPALVPLNETLQPPEGSVGMMQIDCEVLDTRLIHIKKSIVPDYMHNKHTKPRKPPQHADFSTPKNTSNKGR